VAAVVVENKQVVKVVAELLLSHTLAHKNGQAEL
jgi:hypothetical protein